MSAGILWSGRELLLVEQESNEMRYWSLPGGVVEADETATQGLIREVEEEAGLRITEVKAMAHVTEIRSLDSIVIATVFEVSGWQPSTGLNRVGDPAGEVQSAEFMPINQAKKHLALLPWPAMYEPILDYLSGSGQPYYFYEDREGVQVRIEDGLRGRAAR
ncbi:NUDIX hydrolase [Streptomyces sp. LZ34]